MTSPFSMLNLFGPIGGRGGTRPSTLRDVPWRARLHPRRNTFSPLLLLALLHLAACNRATQPALPDQPLAVTISLSTNTIHVGDVVTATLRAHHPAGGELRLPEPGNGKDLVVRDRQTETAPLPNNRARTDVTYRLTSFRVGEHVLATGRVECALSDGQVLDVPYPFANLTVETTLTDPETVLRDIKGPARWPGTWPRWTWGLFLVALLALLGGLLARFILRRPPEAAPRTPPKPPHEVALEALRALLAKGWIESDQAEPFYVELSAIVRRYIEERFALRAPERTTEEFIREAAASRRLTDAHQELVRAFLEQSDLVKFARHRPARDDMHAAHAAAERLVVETMPQTQPTPSREEAA
ncbi:MAG: hypothetical protein JXB04_05415 [Kiritimatiellae bacterium]|nr:hypothetical protein [Kiritimatiellia bacterium]